MPGGWGLIEHSLQANVRLWNLRSHRDFKLKPLVSRLIRIEKYVNTSIHVFELYVFSCSDVSTSVISTCEPVWKAQTVLIQCETCDSSSFLCLYGSALKVCGGLRRGRKWKLSFVFTVCLVKLNKSVEAGAAVWSVSGATCRRWSGNQEQIVCPGVIDGLQSARQQKYDISLWNEVEYKYKVI